MDSSAVWKRASTRSTNALTANSASGALIRGVAAVVIRADTREAQPKSLIDWSLFRTLIRGHPEGLERTGFRLSPALAEAASRRQAGMTIFWKPLVYGQILSP